MTEDNAYVDSEGQSYELGEQLFGQIKRSFAQQQKQSGGQPSLKRFGINPAEWLDDPKVEDGEDVGGDATRKVSGDVDVKQVVTDVLEALRSPALRSQLESQGQTVPQIPEVSDDDDRQGRRRDQGVSLRGERGRGRHRPARCSPRPSSTFPRAPTRAR